MPCVQAGCASAKQARWAEPCAAQVAALHCGPTTSIHSCAHLYATQPRCYGSCLGLLYCTSLHWRLCSILCDNRAYLLLRRQANSGRCVPVCLYWRALCRPSQPYIWKCQDVVVCIHTSVSAAGNLFWHPVLLSSTWCGEGNMPQRTPSDGAAARWRSIHAYAFRGTCMHALHTAWW